MPTRRLNHYGDHQKLHSGVWKVDRLGLMTGAVELHVKGEEQGEINFNFLNTRNAPTQIGTTSIHVPCVSVERTYDGTGMGVYKYAYEGQATDFTFDDNNITFELDFSMNQEPIEAHPDFANLKGKYGWSKLKRQFAEFMPSSSNSGSSGFGGARAERRKKNPHQDTDSYLEVGAIFRKTYLRHSIPGAVLRGLGTIITTPPGLGQFPMDTGATRNWLKLAPKIIRRGNVVQISEEWMVSRPRGWNKGSSSRALLS